MTPLPARARLLVVDDQPVNIQTLYRIFAEDSEVLMATSGAQALASCQAHRPDLVLLDVLMPDMDGHEVCRRLKEDPATRDIPVIFVTAQSDPAEVALGFDVGAVDFISKPVDAAVVRARVRTHVLLRRTLADVSALNASLEMRVRERTAELEAAMARLQESQEMLANVEAKAMLSTLIASVSHELGTPIGNSRIMAATLRDQAHAFAAMVEAGTLKRSELNAHVEGSVKGAELLLRNLDRASELLGSFRQVAADQASEQRREFRLASVIQDIIGTLAPTLSRHPHRVEIDVPAEIVMHSQPGSLGQVVINLVNNAYLHAFEGMARGQLRIAARAEGETVVMTVTDNGKGMSASHLERLFEPFFSTKIGKGGTGLGMSIVQNLVQKTLGGELEVASAPGEGTRYAIRLPLRLPEAVA